MRQLVLDPILLVFVLVLLLGILCRAVAQSFQLRGLPHVFKVR